MNCHASLVASCLLRSAPWENPHRSGTVAVPDGLNGPSKAVSVGEQQHHRGNAPGHTEHGQHGLAHVVAHRPVGLLQQIAFHAYSFLNASTGCSTAAWLAG